MEDLSRSQMPIPNPQRMGELRVQSAKLEQIIAKLRERDKALFGMCENAVKKSDMIRARIYANEMARIRDLIKTITHSQLAIECIVIRLENFIELYSLITDLKPLSKLIQNVAGHVSKVMPDIASEMQQLNTLVGDTLMETSVDFSQLSLESMFSATSQDSEAILKEVSKQLEKKLMDELPTPPSEAVNAPSMPFAQRVKVEAIPVSYETPMRSGKTEVPVKASQADETKIVIDDFLQVLDDLSAKSRAKLEECVA